MAEEFRQYREQQKQRRAARLPAAQQDIEDLAEQGYSVRKLTEYQYRIDETLDLYPIHRRFHNIKTQKRGNYTTALQCAKTQLLPVVLKDRHWPVHSGKWEFERSSGFAGYRCQVCHVWIYNDQEKRCNCDENRNP